MLTFLSIDTFLIRLKLLDLAGLPVYPFKDNVSLKRTFDGAPSRCCISHKIKIKSDIQLDKEPQLIEEIAQSEVCGLMLQAKQ